MWILKHGTYSWPLHTWKRHGCRTWTWRHLCDCEWSVCLKFGWTTAYEVNWIKIFGKTCDYCLDHATEKCHNKILKMGVQYLKSFGAHCISALWRRKRAQAGSGWSSLNACQQGSANEGKIVLQHGTRNRAKCERTLIQPIYNECWHSFGPLGLIPAATSCEKRQACETQCDAICGLARDLLGKISDSCFFLQNVMLIVEHINNIWHRPT